MQQSDSKGKRQFGVYECWYNSYGQLVRPWKKSFWFKEMPTGIVHATSQHSITLRVWIIAQSLFYYGNILFNKTNHAKLSGHDRQLNNNAWSKSCICFAYLKAGGSWLMTICLTMFKVTTAWEKWFTTCAWSYDHCTILVVIWLYFGC